MRTWALQIGLALAGSTLVLVGLVFCGKATGDAVRGQERYTVSFLDIDCTTPPDFERPAFLSEVQYLATMPSQLHLLDEDLAPQLTAAFGCHPWVEEVEQVEFAAPDRIRVRLRFRTPVLAVPEGSKLRAVDCHGVLLPSNAATLGLPVFTGLTHAPGPAGQPWDDSAVVEAARTAAQQ